MSRTGLVLFFLFQIIAFTLGDFIVPDVIIEAYKPAGFRASIPSIDGLQIFRFNANLNKELSPIENGQFSVNVVRPINDTWSYFNPDVKLKNGDVIYYHYYVQYQHLGYRKTVQTWTITDLSPLDSETCLSSDSITFRRSRICINTTIFQDAFNSKEIDMQKWEIEHYIPTQGPDFEFVSYQNRPDVCLVENNRLFIIPKVVPSNNDVKGTLNLQTGCTRKSSDECEYTQIGVFLLPPVVSGRLVSRLKFRYGKVEIRAKLPAGDWIYPQIYLEQVGDPSRKLWIAYARGNDELSAAGEEDIGGRLLYGGLVLQPTEPQRSTYLKTHRNTIPFSSDMHTYTIVWERDGITISVDGVEYGRISEDIMRYVKFSENDLVRLVLGVGVGGINDFPDGYRSNKQEKPWINLSRALLKNFYSQKDTWLRTWRGLDTALQVDYIKITAV